MNGIRIEIIYRILKIFSNFQKNHKYEKNNKLYEY